MAKKTIKNLPEKERPREKLLQKGSATLSDRELIAVLLGKGSKKYDVLTLSEKVIKVIDEKGLNLEPKDLSRFDGIGTAKATLILAAIEFTRRRIKPDGLKIETPAEILPLIRHFADRKQEHFICVSINGANEVMNIRVVSIGLVDRSQVHPREVFADPITDRASGVILVHNHPIGSLKPSTEDIEVTKRLNQAGEIMGITVLDHIIFNQNGYFSFIENEVKY